jgi:hypothetical protein
MGGGLDLFLLFYLADYNMQLMVFTFDVIWNLLRVSSWTAHHQELSQYGVVHTVIMQCIFSVLKYKVEL